MLFDALQHITWEMVANKYKVAVNFIQCEKLRMYRVADTNKHVSRFKYSVFGSMS